MQKLKDALRRFLSGRYGMDALGFALLIVGFALLIAAKFLLSWLIFPAYVVLIFCVYRCWSRDFSARRAENAWLVGLFSRLKDRKNRYFRCPGCRQPVRVPRGKGKICIHCPKCGRQFLKTT